MIRRFALLFAVALLISISQPVRAEDAATATPVVTRDPRVAGDAFDLIPPGKAGELTVVDWAITDPPRGEFAFVVRNETGQEVAGAKVVATLRTKDGALFAVSDGASVAPTRVVAGGIGLGFDRFTGVDVSGELTIEFAVSLSEHGDTMAEFMPGLAFKSAALMQTRIVGEATNDRDAVANVFAVRGICYVSGKIASAIYGDLPVMSVPPGETVPFQVNLSAPCEHFLAVVV